MSLRQPIWNKFVMTARRLLAMLAVFAFSALPALAQAPDPYGIGFATATGLATGDIRTIVARIINVFLGLLGMIAVCLVMYAGFLWMTAKGDESQVQKAKDLLKNALIGLLIIVSAYGIAYFIIRALTGATNGTVEGCEPGQVCRPYIPNFDTDNSTIGFRPTGFTPGGSGRNGDDKGWPKNWGIRISFNSPVDLTTADSASIIVTRCNPRLGLTGSAQPFDDSACKNENEVSGTYTNGGADSIILFKPKSTPGEHPDWFEGDYWYRIYLQGGIIKDSTIEKRGLGCNLLTTVGIASQSVPSDYCKRAIAFSNIVDLEPPTVAVTSPATPPAVCAYKIDPLRAIYANGNDDFLVSFIEFLLDGTANNLVNEVDEPMTASFNGENTSPGFNATDIYARIDALPAGTHSISARATDGGDLKSAWAKTDFTLLTSSCCNGQKDAEAGETGVDCGVTSQCNSCSGDPCTKDTQCASGSCVAGKCVDRPLITKVDPLSGGFGSTITISGERFGNAPGSIVFLGANGDGDDVTVSACDPKAWTNSSVGVTVPTGAPSGPIKLVTATGLSDRTDEFGGAIPDFRVTAEKLPGICYIQPSSGASGVKFAIHGTDLGTPATGRIQFGPYLATYAACGQGSVDECGWTGDTVWAVAPARLKDASYPVKIGNPLKISNGVGFLMRASSSSLPPIVTGVIPTSGPVGSYVTIKGSNFGNTKGKVYFKYGIDEALAGEPVCEDNWHDDYIIVKVPAKYTTTEVDNGLQVSSTGKAHTIRVVTNSALPSNGNVEFKATNEPPRPGICSISPDNGPPGLFVTVKGEGFGSRPGTERALPRYSVEFYKKQTKVCLNDPTQTCTNLGQPCDDTGAKGVCGYTSISSTDGSWSNELISTPVAGGTFKHCTILKTQACTVVGKPCSNPAHGTCIDDREGWPESGPVYVVADSLLSTNAIPFRVQDCNESGKKCAEGESCCANGSCQAYCGPVERESAYGWIMSTSALPTMPRVVENASCSAEKDGKPAVLKSPAPSNGTTDACINSSVHFAFTRAMDKTTFTAGTVTMLDCGSDDAPECGTTKVDLAPFVFACVSTISNSCTEVMIRPAATYNEAKGFFIKKHWYRVILASNSTTSTGLREPGNGRFLDGDVDNRQGGNYVLNFRASDTDSPCEIEDVTVMPTKATIEESGAKKEFNAALIGPNCQILQCTGNQPVKLAWSISNVDSAFLAFIDDKPENCAEEVRGKLETPPSTPALLRIAAASTLRNNAPVKNGSSSVTVSYEDPKVIAVFPAAACAEVCVDAAIGADFNVNMERTSLNSNTVKVWKCRNASCNPPYEAVDNAQFTVVPQLDGGYVRGVRISLGTTMSAATSYIARLYGGPTGITSTSGVALTGLNDGAFYSWKFTTRKDPSTCAVARTTVAPIYSSVRLERDRVVLSAKAYGSKDACSPNGQELDARLKNWIWDFGGTNNVISGFLNGASTTAAEATRVDTNKTIKAGCTSSCTLAGSQKVEPQCGDGVVDPTHEECDDGNMADTDFCGNNCLLRGNTAATCGDKIVNSTLGEACDASVDAATGEVKFPPGCKPPGSDGRPGCIYLGSQSPNAICGNGLREDGESCDDRNKNGGDGCSAQCLLEGSKRSCLDAGTTASTCVNLCGNKRTEPGEDSRCDAPGLTGIPDGCNNFTCLLAGTSSCPNGGPKCCGNNITDKGEDEGCEGTTFGQISPFCTDSCLLKGSSAMYSAPSFCGDGTTGLGENAWCDNDTTAHGDNMTDHIQVVEVASKAGATTATPNTTKVRAYVSTVPKDEDKGTATVQLQYLCKETGTNAGNAICLAAGGGQPYSCTNLGTCAPSPSLTVSPTAYNACRNSEVTITFDQLMDSASVTANFRIGYDNGTSACPTDNPEISALSNVRGNWFARAWHSIVDFIKTRIVRPVFGAPPNLPSPSEQGNRYCAIKGALTVETEGTGVLAHTVARFSPERAMPAKSYIMVRMLAAAKGINGAMFGPTGVAYNHFFATSNDICAVASVNILPESILLQKVSSSESVRAVAVSATGIAIVPTYDYSWTWGWTQVTQDKAVVLEPVESQLSTCTLGKVCNDTSCNCTNDAGSCTIPNKNVYCTITAAATAPMATSKATVRVRGAVPTDAPQGVAPRNTEAPVTIQATASLPNGAKVSSISTDTEGIATVLLCANPWPKFQTCRGVGTAPKTLHLPWEAESVTRACRQDTWYPFTDARTNTSLYYCRDMQATGDTSAGESGNGATATLPCLKESVVRIAQPNSGVLHEFLFTMETDPLKCPNGPIANPVGKPAASWIKDALGYRVSANGYHLSVGSWYSQIGFTGKPTPTKIDGYDALQEGRTVYVGAAAMTSPSNFLYTNISTFSHSDAASPETTTIFDQMLRHVNFNTNPGMQDVGLCKTPVGTYLSCNTDTDCRKGANGALVQGRTYTCNTFSHRCMNGSTILSNTIGAGVSCTNDLDCPSVSTGCLIKGNINGSNVKLYHLPGCTSYNGTQIDREGERMFCTEAEARAAGWTKVSGCTVPYLYLSGPTRCDASKTKLRHDVKRWADLVAFRSATIRSAATTGSAPTLAAGSFLRGRSVSAWSSWGDALSKELSSVPPTDPVNRLGQCAVQCTLTTVCADVAGCKCASEGTSGCTVKQGDLKCTTQSPIDPKTCWNDTTATYIQPPSSLVYTYISTGGPNFSLSSNFEFGAGFDRKPEWKGQTCPELTGNFCKNDPSCSLTCTGANAGRFCSTDSDCGAFSTCGGACTYKQGSLNINSPAGPFTPLQTATTSVGGAVRCGDGIVSLREDCEYGQTKRFTCRSDDRNGTQEVGCAIDCQWAAQPAPTSFATPGPLIGKCEVGQCGDGIVQIGEACDDGLGRNGTYGYCAAGCGAVGASCGDGTIQPGESCDCAERNGQYAKNGIASTVGANQCYVGTTNVPTCGWDCHMAGPSCGDGIVSGGEQCDGGFEEFKGYCNDSNKTGCNDDSQCRNLGVCTSVPGRTGKRCSDDIDKSCGSDIECLPHCGSFCPKAEQRQRRNCGENDPTTTQDDTKSDGTNNACGWSNWYCTAQGTCGDGAVQAGEQCDDHNNNSYDDCIIDGARGLMCVKPRCGDMIVSKDVTTTTPEECDNGDAGNATSCVPPYNHDGPVTCPYCKVNECVIKHVPGPYCGNGKIDIAANSNEVCDGRAGADDQSIICLAGTGRVPTVCQADCFGSVCPQGSNPCNLSRECPRKTGTALKNCIDALPDLDNDNIPDSCDPDQDGDGVIGGNTINTDCNDRDAKIKPGQPENYIKPKMIKDESCGFVRAPVQVSITGQSKSWVYEHCSNQIISYYNGSKYYYDKENIERDYACTANNWNPVRSSNCCIAKHSTEGGPKLGIIDNRGSWTPPWDWNESRELELIYACPDSICNFVCGEGSTNGGSTYYRYCPVPDRMSEIHNIVYNAIECPVTKPPAPAGTTCPVITDTDEYNTCLAGPNSCKDQIDNNCDQLIDDQDSVCPSNIIVI